MASRQSWKIEKNVRFTSKTDSFDFDGLPFKNQLEFSDVMYLILKV